MGIRGEFSCFSRFASDKNSVLSLIRPRFGIYRRRISVHHEASSLPARYFPKGKLRSDRVFPIRFQNRFQNRSNLRVNCHLQFCPSKLVQVNCRRSLLSTDTPFIHWKKWFRHTRGHCETFSILTTIFCMVYQYSAKVSQSQPIYQFTHCCALYECIETSASRRSSGSVTS